MVSTRVLASLRSSLDGGRAATSCAFFFVVSLTSSPKSFCRQSNLLTPGFLPGTDGEDDTSSVVPVPLRERQFFYDVLA